MFRLRKADYYPPYMHNVQATIYCVLECDVMQSGSRRVCTTDYMTSHRHKTVIFTVPAPRTSNATRKLRTDRVLEVPTC